MEHETAGDPVTGLKWTRKTTEKIAEELVAIDINVSANTVAKILKKLGFSLRVNNKKRPSGNKNPPSPKDRDTQFKNINNLKKQFAQQNNPIISVDTKKKEKIGNFKNDGNSWQQTPISVNDHDYPQDAIGKGIPYGIYDIEKKKGFIFLGTSFDTPEFAVDAIDNWWNHEGAQHYHNCKKLLILADCGGSNGCRSRAWKYHIQNKICNIHNIEVTVCHYPPGTSKWNPIEHRLFSEISKNWAGIPLASYEIMLNYIRTTTTKKGLTVDAVMSTHIYEKGEKISDKDMNLLSIKYNDILPMWNYTLSSSRM